MTDTEHGGMTAHTPEQMRELADVRDALRAAADRLEALERWQERVRWNSSDVADEADAYLTADTAPQEDRDA